MIVNGKRGIVMGMANKFSIAYGISESLKDNGADLIFTAQTEYFKEKIQDAAKDFSKNEVFICDVIKEGDIEFTFEKIFETFGPIDFIVHSIAFSDKNELQGKYMNTSRENFLNTMNISCYSLVEVCKNAQKIMPNGGSILSLTYYGSEKYVPNYNVMAIAKSALESSVRYLAHDLGEFGIRVNSVSAGPIKTLAASGVGGFSKILDYDRKRSPLQRNVTQKDIGKACTFLLSNMASGITGEVVHVDCGCNTIGVNFEN